jgi:hypothetical protein
MTTKPKARHRKVRCALVCKGKRAARAYVRLHKRYRFACVTGIFTVELTALILTHEFAIHFGIAVATFTWDSLITAIEEEIS